MIPSDVRILVCTEPQDMRRSFDGLCLAVEQYVGADPKSGALFVFTNKRKNRLKVLWFDRNGFCIPHHFVLDAASRLDHGEERGRRGHCAAGSKTRRGRAHAGEASNGSSTAPSPVCRRSAT